MNELFIGVIKALPGSGTALPRFGLFSAENRPYLSASCSKNFRQIRAGVNDLRRIDAFDRLVAALDMIEV
ncbi:hypothetical protein, partial [Rhizobium johnstonii]|uniref:hypothetical protein n=1 Tax=Rhizobium johnstonii TaxID=3019933 RepID=UPI003F947122